VLVNIVDLIDTFGLHRSNYHLVESGPWHTLAAHLTLCGKEIPETIWKAKYDKTHPIYSHICPKCKDILNSSEVLEA
jgi:hypothetical protein